MTTQPLCSTSTPESAFKHRSTKSRSLRQAEKHLPQSPRKKNEIIKIIASKHLKINFRDKCRRKKKLLGEQEEEWLSSFLDRPDISRQTPGRKDSVYKGKVDGIRQYKQKRYLQWTLRELLSMINGKMGSDDETFP